jgi:hypothetical protein
MDLDSTLDADFISFEDLDNTNKSVWEMPSTISRQSIESGVIESGVN